MRIPRAPPAGDGTASANRGTEVVEKVPARQPESTPDAHFFDIVPLRGGRLHVAGCARPSGRSAGARGARAHRAAGGSVRAPLLGHLRGPPGPRAAVPR